MDLLLLVGGDVVQIQLAQLTGSRWLTPAAFSFGWLAYSFMYLAAIVGGREITPDTDVSAIVINGITGYSRDIQNWMLGRLLTDFESGYWMTEKIRSELARVRKTGGESKAGLVVSFFEATSDKKYPDNELELRKGGVPATEPKRGFVWYFGWLVILIQLGIAAIPWAIWREWEVFLVTGCANILSVFTASLAVWRKERWSCRRLDKEATYIITRGNGAQHAIVIFAKPGSLNLEDLATMGGSDKYGFFFQLWTAFQLVLWVALLITVDGWEHHTWFLVAVGSVGMIYAIIAATAPKRPDQWGVILKPHSDHPVIASDKTMISLMQTEMAFPRIGQSMLETFFNSAISKDETEFWKMAKAKTDAGKTAPKGSKAVNAMAQKLSAEIEIQLQTMVAKESPSTSSPSTASTSPNIEQSPKEAERGDSTVPEENQIVIVGKASDD